MAPYIPDNSLPDVYFKHSWQFKWYKKVDLVDLSKLAMGVCTPSEAVLKKAAELAPLTEGRTAILYRGNDKQKEIRETPYEAIVAMAREPGILKFIVQTDEEEFYFYFKNIFRTASHLKRYPG